MTVDLSNFCPKRTCREDFSSSREPSALYCAIVQSRTDDTLQLLRSRVQFPLIENGRSNLILAIKNRPNMEVIKALVLRSDLATLDYIDNQTTNALMTAADGGHLDVVRLLLENKANPNIHDQLLRTPLWYAVYSKDWVFYSAHKMKANEAGQRILQIAQMLLKHDATIDPLDDKGRTPLQSHVNSPLQNEIYPQVISYLVEEGADATRAVRTNPTTPKLTAKIQEAVQQGLIRREAKPSLKFHLQESGLLRLVLDYV